MIIYHQWNMKKYKNLRNKLSGKVLTHHVNAIDLNGDTALHIAIQEGYSIIAKILITLGADPYIRNAEGLDAFQIALALGDGEIIALLAPIHYEELQILDFSATVPNLTNISDEEYTNYVTGIISELVYHQS